MPIFILVILSVLGLSSLSVIYNIRYFHSCEFIRQIKNKKLSWLVSAIPMLLVVIFGIFFGFTSAVIVMLHLTAFLLLFSLISLIIKKIAKKAICKTVLGISAIFLTSIYIGTGFYFANTIYKTSYKFETSKQLEPLRIVQIADAHLGVTLDGSFSGQMPNIQKTLPDIVVITGDFVDDSSSKADMIEACRHLGNLQSKYGIYFTFGNHDKGYMKNSTDYTEKELRAELEKNNVTILEDEAVLINNSFYIIGRQDKSEKKRKSIDELTENLDKSKYMVVLDHQPNDYDNEARAEVDLVLSGHTHGGHIFPAGYIGVLIGANDMAYGTKHINNTDFVVTSGISGWEIPFKTGCISEYVVIDIY